MPTLTPDQQLQALQRQASQAWSNAQLRGSQGYASDLNGRSPGASGNLDEYNRIQQQIATMQGGMPQTPDRITADRNATFNDTEGRGTATMDDPRVNAALDQLQGVMNGTDAPYTQRVQDQLLARQGDMSAAAEGANADTLREGIAARGGSMLDPSAQAALHQLTQGRQQENQAAAGDIGTQATLQNFGARMNATGQLASTRLAQLGEANSQFNQGAHYRSLSQQTGAHVNGQTQAGLPSSLRESVTGGMQIPQFRFQPLQVPQSQPAAAGGQTRPAAPDNSASPVNYSNYGPWAGGYNQTQNPNTTSSETGRANAADQDFARRFRSQWEDPINGVGTTPATPNYQWF